MSADVAAMPATKRRVPLRNEPRGIFAGNSLAGRRYGAWWEPDADGVFHIHWPTVEEVAGLGKHHPEDALPWGSEFARMLVAVRDGTAIIEDKPG